MPSSTLPSALPASLGGLQALLGDETRDNGRHDDPEAQGRENPFRQWRIIHEHRHDRLSSGQHGRKHQKPHRPGAIGYKMPVIDQLHRAVLFWDWRGNAGGLKQSAPAAMAS